jgi:hypothetical protein
MAAPVMSDRPGLNLAKLGPLGTIVGLIGAGAAAAVAWTDPKASQSYLFAWFFFGMMSLGFLGFLCLHHTVRGKWGLPVMRIFEAGASPQVLITMAIAFLPVVIPVLSGKSSLYEWSHADVVANDPILQHKAPYLNPVFWTIRFVLFFLIWIGISNFLAKSTAKQDETGEYSNEQRRSQIAPPGLVAFFVTATFAATDWFMSLEPHWYSTIYGVWNVVGAGLMALSVTVLIVTTNKDREPYKGLITPKLTKDLGNLLFALTMLWGYTSLSQYLIIWSGNIPEYTSYFVNRRLEGWQGVGLALILGQFFIPFFALLAPRTKAVASNLAKVAGWILVMRLLDSYYMIMPSFQASSRPTPMPQLWDFVAFIGVGGLWLMGFCLAMKSKKLIPTYDERLFEGDGHGH